MFFKRLTVFLAMISILLSSNWWATQAARDTWISVRSKHLLVVGNAGDHELRQVSTRLEQFRDAVSQVFAGAGLNERVPTTVIVFKNDDSYRPFKISENNAGYFQPGQDVNYITLSLESRGDQDSLNIVFHEFTHLLVNTSIGTAPAWLNEGLAEFYSTLNFSSDRKIVLGRPISRHVTLLRRNSLIPLRELFQADYKSPHYGESIFYAESWALMHYLMIHRGGQRASQLWKFLDSVRTNVPTEQAFQDSFQTTFEGMENELRRYIQQDSYAVNESNLVSKAETEMRLTATPVSEAESQAYLGDLLLHGNRAEAEEFLQRALALDPNLAMAHASLGMLHFRQGKLGEALINLERAVAADTTNYLVHYYYAYILSHQSGSGFSSESAAAARRELKKAIFLRPDFPQSYNLLAYVNLVTSTEVDETILLLNGALERLPGRTDFIYMLGQLYMYKDDYKKARLMFDRVMVGNVEDKVRRHAEKLLATITTIEAQRAQKEAMRRARGLPLDSSLSTDDPIQPSDPSMALREVLRIPGNGESRTQGRLMSIECEQGGLVFVVKTNDRVLRLRTDTFQQIRRTTFTSDVRGTLTCGKRRPETSVVVCYLPVASKEIKSDGVLSSVEFVPEDFSLTP
jgi:tetratricopeptide (TPR) repeat protein